MTDNSNNNGHSNQPTSPMNLSVAYPGPVTSPIAEKWSIATYLRIKPFSGEASEQIIYDLEGKRDRKKFSILK
jgi:hypothetical protein